MKIAILEHNHDRQAAMLDCLEDRFHQFEKKFFASSSDMIGYLKDNLADTIAISLDHDLEFQAGAEGSLTDAGDGRLVADFLAAHAPSCPVVIHTTNSAAGTGMEMALHDAGWKTFRVYPWGDVEWIPAVWFPAMRNAIVGSVVVEKRLHSGKSAI